MKKRLFALLLALIMILGLIPAHAATPAELPLEMPVEEIQEEMPVAETPVEESQEKTPEAEVPEAETPEEENLEETLDIPGAPFRITAPVDATVELFRQSGFHSISLVAPQFTQDLGDGTQVVGFPAGGTHYRVSMEGQITRTGFTTSGDLTVAFAEPENPQTQVDQRSTHRAEASTMVNINSRNHLTMDVGDTFPLRGFRAAWEIVNSETANQIVQPDFHVNILYGEDVVSITPIPNQSSLFTISAQEAGTAIIEVYYDAIYNENRGTTTLYGATNPVRRSVVVISVGQNTANADFDGWDTEFDTVYYLNTQPNGHFPIDASRISTVEVAHVSGGAIGAWQSVFSAHGAYSVPVFAGNNIIRVTDINGARDYQVVRGAQITPIINNGQPVMPGRSFSVRFEGLFTPAPKMGNIYNPSLLHLAGTHGNQIAYSFNGARTTNGGQYNFINSHTLHFTAPEAQGVFLLTNGNLPTSMWSFGNGFGIHRNLRHGGANNGGYAPTFTRFSSILPDVPVVVGTPEQAELTELIILLETILELDLEGYIPATVVGLQQAIANAQAVIASSDPGGEAILAAIAMLESALEDLREAPFRITLSPEAIFPGDTVTVYVEGSFGAAQAQGASYQLRFSTTIPGRGTVTSSSSSNINAETLRTIRFTIPNDTAPGEYRLHGGHLQRTVRVGQGPVSQTNHFVGDFPEVFIRVQDPDAVDKSQLEAAIIATNALVAPNYTADSWQVLEAALMDAITVLADETATQAQINAALEELSAAVEALVEAVRVDKTALAEAITQAQGLSQANYTAQSWQAMVAARTAAQGVYDDPDATQTQIDTARNNLTAAIIALVPVSGGPGSGNGGGTTAPPPGPRAQISVVDPNYHGEGQARVFLSNRFMDFSPGETVYDLLRRTGLNIESVGHPTMGQYVQSIQGWGEFDAGPASGWMFRVNGVFPDVSSSHVTLQNGDRVEWLFTRDLGQDIAGGGAVGGNGGGSAGGGSGGGQTGTPQPPPGGETEQAPFFADVRQGQWYFSYVAFVHEHGLMNGTAPGVFSPNTNLSRGMTATILWRLAGEPAQAQNTGFSDAGVGMWYSQAIVWASENGIMQGYGNGAFGTNDNITREQLAVAFYNFAIYQGHEVQAGEFTAEFSDQDQIASWAKGPMAWANASGIITGRGQGTLAPNASASRGETAAMLQRFVTTIAD